MRDFNVTGGFADPAELTRGVEERLRAIAAEDLSPWVKVGRAIFRAKEVRIDGDRATIHASVRGHEVADELTGLVDRFGSASTTLAFWDGVYDARVENLSVVSRAGGSREVSLELSISTPLRQQEYSLNGVDYAEGAKTAVEVSWLGRDNPYGLMRSEAEIDDPFAAMAELGVAEESFRPIAFVLAYEILARSRNVGRLTRFRLGPSVAGERKLELAWTQPSSYANEGAVVLETEGTVRS